MKKIYIGILLIALVALFIKIPTSEEEKKAIIIKAQISADLPDEITGYPELLKVGEIEKTKPLLIKEGVIGKYSLKISKRNNRFYWDSWEGQELRVIRGRYYKSDMGLPSAVFFSENNDGTILIYNGTIFTPMLCEGIGWPDIGNAGSNYIEIRSPLVGETEVIKGGMAFFFPRGFEKSICGSKDEAFPEIYFKPSMYENLIKYFE